MFRARRAHHQERQIVSIQPLVTVSGRVVCRTCTRHGHRYRMTATSACIDTVCLSWWWARRARNMYKSKGLPRQAEVAQGVPGRLRRRIFLTFRHNKSGWSSAKCTGHLYPRRNPWYSLSEAKSTSGHMVLWGAPRKKSPVTPPGIDPGTVRLVVQRLNHYGTPGPARNM